MSGNEWMGFWGARPFSFPDRELHRSNRFLMVVMPDFHRHIGTPEKSLYYPWLLISSPLIALVVYPSLLRLPSEYFRLFLPGPGDTLLLFWGISTFFYNLVNKEFLPVITVAGKGREMVE